MPTTTNLLSRPGGSRARGWMAAVLAGALIGSALGSPATAAPPEPLTLTHGMASGDVTPTSAVIWGRASGPARMHVEYSTDPGLAAARSSGATAVDETSDFTGTVRLDRLDPGTRYYYRVWFSGPGGGRAASTGPIGTFVTAPDPDTPEPVTLVWGGDLGGQRYCRQVGEGYAIFGAMAALRPDLFVANGDMIYADGDCPAEGPDGPGGWENIPGDFPSVTSPSVDWTDLSAVREVYRAHWRYNREDPHFQELLRTVPMYSQWDDHEVINDFGAPWTYWNSANEDRDGYPNLVAAGRDTLFEWSPIDRDPEDPNRIYRSFRWGADAELFIVDARSYRSRNDLPDGPGKTLLGEEQLAWLQEGLASSTATWKIVSMDVPISIPTGSNAAVFGRDAWANGTSPDFSAETGFERELGELLGLLDEEDVENVVFITTDVHFAETIAYSTDVDGDGDPLVFHELVSSSLNASRGTPGALDPSFSPIPLYAEGGVFSFGHLRIERGPDGAAHLHADVRDEAGVVRPGSAIDLAPTA